MKITQSIVKWAGSKAKIAKDLFQHFRDASTYVEPFVGAGSSLFQAIQSGKYSNYKVNDVNKGMISLFRSIQSDVRSVVSNLIEITDAYNDSEYKEAFYYAARTKFNEDKTDYVLFWFLMKCGFNGLYRENKLGKFNGPWGHKERIAFTNKYESLLYQVATLIKHVEFSCMDYEEFINSLDTEDVFVYSDPPYCNSQQYTAEPFNNESLAELLMNTLFPAAISDIDSATSRRTYNAFNMIVVKDVARVINIRAVTNKTEVLYLNY